MKFPKIAPPSTERAFLMYHEKPYFTRKDVVELFDCGENVATKIKALTRLAMAEKNIKLYCEHNELLDKDVVFELAGLDIAKITKSFKVLQEVRK